MKKIKQTKKDLIALGLYAMIRMSQNEANKYAKVLEKHLTKNYSKKDKSSWDFSGIIWDSAFANDRDDVNYEDFEENLKHNTNKK